VATCRAYCAARDSDHHKVPNERGPETLGYTDQAVKQLKSFSKLVPSDKLAPELVKAFTQEPDTGRPKAQAG
jgi:hypothetical protein